MKDNPKSYQIAKVLNTGYACLCKVHDEQRGKRTVQVFDDFIGKLGQFDDNLVYLLRQYNIPIVKAKAKTVIPRYWNTLRSQIYIRDNGICWICKRFVLLDEYELGHLVDRDNGGKSVPENLAVMHKLCNARKPRHKTLKEHNEWLLKTRLLPYNPNVKTTPTIS